MHTMWHQWKMEAYNDDICDLENKIKTTDIQRQKDNFRKAIDKIIVEAQMQESIYNS